MKIVTVIPISRGIFREYLTYFTAQEVEAGDLAKIIVRNKATSALIIKTESLSNSASTKSELRSAEFKLKKLGLVITKQFLDKSIIHAAQATADYYASSLGVVLKSLLPQALLTNNKTRKNNKKTETDLAKSEAGKAEIKTEKLALQDSDLERLTYYKSLIREEFAKKCSVLICFASLAELMNAKNILEKGISAYTVILHSQLSPKIFLETWQEAIANKHPVLILTTVSGLTLPRNDLSTIILERESAAAYRGFARPFIDYRYFAEKLAQAKSLKLILGDILLRPETGYRLENREIMPVQAPRARLASLNETKLLNVAGSEILTTEVKSLIAETNHNHEKIFLLANRRGLAPLIVCDDCGQAMLCGNCGAPVVLHQAEKAQQGIKETTIFRCHQCGETRTSEEKCKHCQSWRLRALGTGIEKVAAELKILAPHRAIFQLDSDHIKTYKQASDLMTKFYQSQDGILLGTEMALNYLSEKVTHSVVVTVDAMLALPDFRISERVFTLISRLRALTSKTLLIQTRQEQNETLAQAERGNLLEFYRSEIALREKLVYPPFSLLIKITREATTTENRQIFKLLAQRLEKYEPAVYPALHQPSKHISRLNLLLKLKASNWPDAELASKLKALPPDFVIHVDPESVLWDNYEIKIKKLCKK